MAFQQVSTCRFYVNVVEWLNSLGYNTGAPAYRFHTLPVTPTSFIGESGYDLSFPSPAGGFVNVFAGNNGSSNGFYALLGHNIFSSGSNFGISDIDCGVSGGHFDIENIINFEGEFNGFSLAKMNMTNDATINVGYVSDANHSFEVSSIVLGTYYDMPHSPDLQLTMSTEYGRTKTIETKGGASRSNTFYIKPPMWGRGDTPAWELDNTVGYFPPELAKSGRRIWDLSFSYLDDGDVWGSNQSLGVKQTAEDVWTYYVPFETSGADSGDILYNDDSYAIGYNYNILDDYNFYSQVIHRLNGGQLPFIFQPDNSDNSPQSFALCKFDMKSFQFQQQAPGLYRISLKIREVW